VAETLSMMHCGSVAVYVDVEVDALIAVENVKSLHCLQLLIFAGLYYMASASQSRGAS
jgi:putative Ca2+/H+ antiporter (TMEM165/GDT1 family)